MKTVLVTGGAGYVGAVLTPKLLDAGCRVRVLDWFLFHSLALDAVAGNPGLELFRGDLRNDDLVRRAVVGCDAVIHLACISNDPSFDLNPTLGKSINYDAFGPLLNLSIEAGVKRFVFASSSSVYGLKSEPNVTEDLPLEPLTDYSRYKALCESDLLAGDHPGLCKIILRPATVCGYSPRLRLDLTVNILTNHAVNRGVIRVFGGSQMRPNIHIDDVADLYVQSLEWPAEKVDGKIFNAGYENHTVRDIAEIVKRVVEEVMQKNVGIETTATDDLRSYHICSDKIRREVGYQPKRTIEDAVRDLVHAFQQGKIPDAMDDVRYFNVKAMKAWEVDG